ncbi:SLAP domain-containing protein [Lactobacillus sp. B4005]|uniref:SLAP domain-containing protein n=1 Tax=Lactobacillus sp. B4005 TaxID=2818031 RepID=UPI002B40D694|nr:SLAP domain-containing protein [Lactobacillus sp. B4005]MCX8723980.1 SLAP domain-containing protein [Lactobacillus sp. B4005]
MKKNLRIVSAAAAALLAVAPVAASSVSTVFADIDMNGQGGVASNGANVKLALTVKNSLNLVKNDPASKLAATLSYPVLPAGAQVTTATASKTADIYRADQVEVATTGDNKGRLKPKAADATDLPAATTQFTDETAKYVAVAHITIIGLNKDTTYSIDLGGTNVSVKPDASGVIADLAVISQPFSLSDAKLSGAPYLRLKPVAANGTTPEVKAKAVASGSVDLTKYTTAALNDEITKKYEPATTTQEIADTVSASAAGQPGDGIAKSSFVDLDQDVTDALKAAGVTVKNDGSFDKPATTFTVNVRLQSSNGRTNTVPVVVDPNPTKGDFTYPEISWKVNGTKVPKPAYGSGNTIDSIDTIDGSSFNYVPVNGVVDTTAIKNAFTVQVSGTDRTPLPLNVDTSKVNTKVAGKYPVEISATNADNKKTTKVTFYITVGAKGATYKTVQSDGDVPVYKIEGNTVTDTKTTVKNGDQIAVFGDAIKVGDKSYTRINSADSNLYVETKYVDGSFKPADKTSKTVMHNAYIYDKDHKRVGTNMLRAYTKVDVLGAATKLADGSLVYQIGDNQYVMADNIDGTVRTLSHNAYVYKTSKKRADSRVLRKGAKVTTYGSPYTFKNGKAYYRIGGPSKQYVKVANFN